MNALPDSAATAIVALPAILDLRAATPLANALLASRGRELIIDAAQVQRLGGQCLQVLLSAALTWRADDIPLSISKPSPDFLEGLDLLGIRSVHMLEALSSHPGLNGPEPDGTVVLDKDLSR